MAYFCFDFSCVCDAPTVGFPTVVSEPSKNNEEEGLVVAGSKGQPAAAKAPDKGAAGHLQGVAARRGNSPQRAATRGRGRLPAARLQGTAASG
ncbi:hypothetical protein GW17_00061412 [Ensete ventricosum]|nr:hypothetical protein GW17_00061412 [Ensete ventricosum]